MTRLRALTRVDVPLRILFERPTAAGLAEAVIALSWAAQAQAAAVNTADREEIEL
jgi:hypothetical protein